MADGGFESTGCFPLFKLKFRFHTINHPHHKTIKIQILWISDKESGAKWIFNRADVPAGRKMDSLPALALGFTYSSKSGKSRYTKLSKTGVMLRK